MERYKVFIYYFSKRQNSLLKHLKVSHNIATYKRDGIWILLIASMMF